MSFTFRLVAVCLAAAAQVPTLATSARAQRLDQTLPSFESTVDSVRAAGFYHLIDLATAVADSQHPDTATAARVERYAHRHPAVVPALVRLLERENRIVASARDLSAAYDDYYPALIETVAQLRDARAARALAGAMSTGWIAMGGLADLGDAALPVVHGALRSPDWTTRHDAVQVLGALLERRSANGLSARGTASIRRALLRSLRDSSSDVRAAAAAALGRFSVQTTTRHRTAARPSLPDMRNRRRDLHTSARACLPSSEEGATLREYVQRLLLNPADSAFVTVIGATTRDTARVVLVSNDTVCDRVTRVVEASSHQPEPMLVVAFPGGFAACDASGPFLKGVYFIDAEAKRLITLMASVG